MNDITNAVTLLGNLGDDPALTYTQGGVAICKFSLATSHKQKAKDGTTKELTSWHRVVMFGRLAEIANEYLKKGSKIFCTGSIRYGEYEKDGVKRYTTDIVCEQMKMLDGKPKDGEQSQSAPQRQQSAPQRQASQQPAPMDDFAEDDIPW